MGKKLFSLCMALALCLGLLPATALAADMNTVYVGGVALAGSSDSIVYATTNESGEVVKDGANANNYNIKWDGSTLTLNGAKIKGATSSESLYATAGIYAFSNSGDVSLNIALQGVNEIFDSSHGIWVFSSSTGAATLTITGDGSLTASGSLSGILVQSNDGDATLTIQNADVTAENSISSGDGVTVRAGSSSSASLSVDGGSLTATGTGVGSGINFLFGSWVSGSGMPSLTVSGNAMVKASGGDGGISDNSSADIRIGDDNNSSGGIVFNNGTGTVYGNVTLQEDLTIGEGESLTIPDGSKLDCNNNLTNKGTILVETGGTVSGQLKNGTTVTTPSITAQPTGQTVTEGTQAAFSVSATAGSETPTYQWQQSTDNGGSWTDISGATEASYTISSTTTSMSGNQYRCVVKSASGVGVISQAATLTVQAKPAYTVTVNANPTEGGTANADRQTAAEAETVTLTATPNSNYRFVGWTSDGGVTFADASSLSTTFTMPAGNVTITANWQYDPPYIPPTKTPSEQALDKIEDAKPGDTVTINIFGGNTKLDKEVFEKLAGQDITLVVKLPGGVRWTVHGKDIPKYANITDIDMGVSMNTSTIPVDLINAVTGEIGTVQLTLKHNGEFGFTMTLTAPVGVKNAGLWANLYHYDEDAGKMVYQTAALVDKDGNVALPFDHASQYALVLDSKSHELPFTDLTAGAWYLDAVAYVYRHDIMEGMSATTFQPNGTLSRAMAVQIFYNLEGQPDISGENLGYPYEDVDAQAWYGNAVYWAKITGVATGYGDGTFQPTDSITRQEFAQMLYNYAKYKGYDLTAEGDLSQFPDSGSVADWAEAAMSWANGNELINGHDDGTIDAAGIGTRAQAASILMRFDQNLVEK